MKIGTPPVGIKADQPAAPAGPARTPTDDASKAQAAAGIDSSAKVELSNTAATLLSGVAGSQDVFDADKVARISQAISDGTFSVNADAIADKLITNAQELLGKAAR